MAMTLASNSFILYFCVILCVFHAGVESHGIISRTPPKSNGQNQRDSFDFKNGQAEETEKRYLFDFPESDIEDKYFPSFNDISRIPSREYEVENDNFHDRFYCAWGLRYLKVKKVSPQPYYNHSWICGLGENVILYLVRISETEERERFRIRATTGHTEANNYIFDPLKDNVDDKNSGFQ